MKFGDIQKAYTYYKQLDYLKGYLCGFGGIGLTVDHVLVKKKLDLPKSTIDKIVREEIRVISEKLEGLGVDMEEMK